MIAFNFWDFRGSKIRYEQETIMFKRFPNAWPNTRFRIKGVGDPMGFCTTYYFFAAWYIIFFSVLGLIARFSNFSIYFTNNKNWWVVALYITYTYIIFGLLDIQQYEEYVCFSFGKSLIFIIIIYLICLSDAK